MLTNIKTLLTTNLLFFTFKTPWKIPKRKMRGENQIRIMVNRIFGPKKTKKKRPAMSISIISGVPNPAAKNVILYFMI